MLSAIPPQRVFDMFRNGEIRLIDIRESSEYAEKFIPGARLVPLSAIDGQDLKDASMGKGRTAREARQCALPSVQANSDRRRRAGAVRHSGELCLASHVLALGFCRCRSHFCRHHRVLRAGHSALTYAVEPALIRPLHRKRFEIEDIRPAGI